MGRHGSRERRLRHLVDAVAHRISFTQSVACGRTVFEWNPSAPLSVINNGHTIQANVDKGSKIEIDGVPFDLLQFHFHAPSEHTVEGKQMAMETHCVHKSEQGELTVIGVLHALGAENSALASIWNGLPKSENDNKAVPSFDLLSVLPRDRGMFRYAGSLTTTPCTAGVRWHVIQSPTSVSAAQIAAFKELFKDGNSRPVQPIKARDCLKEVPSSPAIRPATDSVNAGASRGAPAFLPVPRLWLPAADRRHEVD
ncbi:MAG: carbonic anhydrase family protein, partial [Dehalococcoidia bacterium]|nr:carbonic anhydrase family protein [Dehalococcoidia bacterium]